jgi:hypothetical protein
MLEDSPMMNVRVLVLALALTEAGCPAPANPASPGDPVELRVTTLVNETVKPESEAAAFSALEELGAPAVPYIVGHLGDVRSLPIRSISLATKGTAAFEGARQYAPVVVHDALSAILNQITGQSFEFVYNGATAEVRARNAQAWVSWCVRTYPSNAHICRRGS